MATLVPPLPMMFREALANAGMMAIDEWWEFLDEPSRMEALSLWHECRHTESDLAIRIEARLQEEPVGFWHNDFYEYLVNHEIYWPQERTFHICTRHPVAAASARAGSIPHDFVCPFHSTNCPMRHLLSLSGGQSLRLHVSLYAKRRATDGGSVATMSKVCSDQR